MLGEGLDIERPSTLRFPGMERSTSASLESSGNSVRARATRIETERKRAGRTWVRAVVRRRFLSR
jgi:hypothetical protein